MSYLGAPELIVIALFLFAIPALAFWIWSLVHCIKNKGLTDNMRILAIVLIVVLGFIGSIVYLFLPRENNPQLNE